MRPLSPWSRRAPAPPPASHAIPALPPARPRSVSPKPTSIGSQPPRVCMLSSLTTLREKVVEIGAKVIAHARYTVFQMAEVAVPRDLFRRILAMIDELRHRQVARC